MSGLTDAPCINLQVMPQLLNELGIDASDEAAPDWGTIAVYTCSASCAPSTGSAYAQEFAFVQPAV